MPTVAPRGLIWGRPGFPRVAHPAPPRNKPQLCLCASVQPTTQGDKLSDRKTTGSWLPAPHSAEPKTAALQPRNKALIGLLDLVSTVSARNIRFAKNGISCGFLTQGVVEHSAIRCVRHDWHLLLLYKLVARRPLPPVLVFRRCVSIWGIPRKLCRPARLTR